MSADEWFRQLLAAAASIGIGLTIYRWGRYHAQRHTAVQIADAYDRGYDHGWQAGSETGRRIADHDLLLAPTIVQARYVGLRTEVPRWERAAERQDREQAQ